MKRIIFCCFIIAAISYNVRSQTVIAAKDARNHIGDTVSITATVFGGRLFTSSNMILLDLGGNNPNQEITLMIPGADKEKFEGHPEIDYKGREITVTGKIIEYKGKPEIVVNDPKQLKVVMIDNVRKSHF